MVHPFGLLNFRPRNSNRRAPGRTDSGIYPGQTAKLRRRREIVSRRFLVDLPPLTPRGSSAQPTPQCLWRPGGVSHKSLEVSSAVAGNRGGRWKAEEWALCELCRELISRGKSGFAMLRQIALRPGGAQTWADKCVAASPSGNLIAYTSTLTVYVYDAASLKLCKCVPRRLVSSASSAASGSLSCSSSLQHHCGR
eukprot:scaffold576_cov260-Pinguiococcus_pyrenoidosus.AAC.76